MGILTEGYLMDNARTAILPAFLTASQLQYRNSIAQSEYVRQYVSKEVQSPLPIRVFHSVFSLVFTVGVG